MPTGPSPPASDRPRQRAPLQYAEELSAVFPPLLLAAQRIAATVQRGVHGRRRVGPGETFWQFRRYEGSDDARMIDWRQSARCDPLFVREMEWEAAQCVWLWRDMSPSMAYRSALSEVTKSQRADLLLLALASLLLRGGERIANLNAGHEAALTTGGLGGRGALERYFEETRTQERIDNGNAEKTTLGLPQSIPGPLPRHARAVLVSDFLFPLEDLKAFLGALGAKGASGHLLQVRDGAEETFPFSGRIRFEGMEGEEAIVVNRCQDTARAYAHRKECHDRALMDLAREMGWSLVRHRSDHPPQSALLALYERLAGMAQSTRPPGALPGLGKGGGP